MGLRRPKTTHVHYRVRCTCNALVSDCGHSPSITHLLSPCIHRQTPRELFDGIVETYVSFREPDPTWFPFALTRIAEAWHQNPDEVFAVMKSAIAEKNGAAAALLPGPYA